ncbi:hypothetical protein F5B22DRAFT_522376 [Xylaria bambusicola]|uniref:uncharacterized protein n=1 Tax=Xylaria bambusicola TaxID=326684 RepID=UPI002007D00A|nr:uncharacterized protein F5B22DRAFT_522376 [Xylaria bambusicola]KAI0505506.1 hypothetical protein F5B22DRAFT_522376 [Xylaria bambusicola]
MPQDPNLYGQRPSKKQKTEIPLSSSLAFASQLNSLMSAPSAVSSASSVGSSSGRPRPSKTKDDIFSSIKAKRKPGPSLSRNDESSTTKSNDSKIKLKHVHNTEEEKKDFARARRKMEEKARLYAAMKRGDYIAKENEAAPLVDFDRKWAEKHPEDDGNERYSSSGSDNESSDDEGATRGTELVEYQDEFGRTRTGTRAEVDQIRRRAARSALGAAELEDMAAMPTARPQNLIFGDAIQTAAFNPEASTLDAMASLAAKRDREPTPPPDTHFDGRAEIRTKGTGFYQFSQEGEARKAEMASLAAERANTERVRREREAEKEKRRREIEERRKKIGARRAEKLADNFLDGLAGEMIGSGKGGEKGDDGVGASKDADTNG